MSKDRDRKIGLARALSKMGFCSRSRASELIRAGRVSLNGRIRRDPESPVSSEAARLLVDGRVVERREKIYLMLNKPRGIVTSASDDKGRPTIYGIVNRHLAIEDPNEAQPWIAPVGRLDKASEGLLLLTNDSEWGARVAAPETHLKKTYHVQIDTVVDDAFARILMQGVECGGGKERERLQATEARVLRTGKKNCWLEIVLDEGRNRQIRRMLKALEAEVLRLVRVSMGPLNLGTLAKGVCRSLTPEEKRAIDLAVQKHGSKKRDAAHG